MITFNDTYFEQFYTKLRLSKLTHTLFHVNFLFVTLLRFFSIQSHSIYSQREQSSSLKSLYILKYVFHMFLYYMYTIDNQQVL